MATTNTLSTMDGFFKTLYADKINNIVPVSGRIYKETKFIEKLGKDFRRPVVLANEAGVTYAASSAGAFALQSSTAMTIAEAIVDGYQIALRSRIDYEAAARAAGSQKAFDNVMRPVVKSMLDTLTKRLELNFLYGQTGLGNVTSSANASATSTVMTVSAATWAPGIWAGMKGAMLSAWGDTGEVNTNAALVVSAVSMANRTITVTGNSTDITALDSAISGTGAGVNLYFYKAFTNEAPGIDKIVTNTGSLFNISATTYDLWKGNSYSTSGALTLAKLDDALTDAVAMGLEEDVDVFIAPKTWSDVMNEQAALRKYDASYNKSKSDNGFEAIEFYSQNGKVSIIPHPYVKQGEGFIVPMDKIERIGASDITFSNPANNEKFFIELQDSAGFELRSYTNQTLFCSAPARVTKISGITN